jgi:hypothetical protein
MARDPEAVKSTPKKKEEPAGSSNGKLDEIKGSGKKNLSGQVRLDGGSGTRGRGGVNRSASHDHADQQECHARSGKEGEFRLVPSTERSGRTESQQCEHVPDPSHPGPTSPRQQPGHAQRDDPKNLKEDDREFKARANPSAGPKHGSSLRGLGPEMTIHRHAGELVWETAGGDCSYCANRLGNEKRSDPRQIKSRT